MVKSQREVTEVLQEATCKIAAQQTETARLTTDAARQICEVRGTGALLSLLSHSEELRSWKKWVSNS